MSSRPLTGLVFTRTSGDDRKLCAEVLDAFIVSRRRSLAGDPTALDTHGRGCFRGCLWSTS